VTLLTVRAAAKVTLLTVRVTSDSTDSESNRAPEIDSRRTITNRGM
jgi:hypothetical protein